MIARYWTIGLLAFAACFGASAQPNLANLVAEANADWMFGKWEAPTDNGGTFSLTVAWDLDKHVTVLHGKGGDLEFKGFSAVDPASGDVKYAGFDNHGVVSKGVWGMESDALVLRFESQGTDGGPRKMAAVFSGSTSQGLQLRIHALDASGGLVAPARLTLAFKKK